MQLNKLAGRTFNDLMQYPIFPFVLSDYTSQSLDLHAEKTFRNLRKPIAIQVRIRSLFLGIGHARDRKHIFRTSVRGSGTSPTTTLSSTSWKEMSRTMITSWMKTPASVRIITDRTILTRELFFTSLSVSRLSRPCFYATRDLILRTSHSTKLQRTTKIYAFRYEFSVSYR